LHLVQESLSPVASPGGHLHWTKQFVPKTQDRSRRDTNRVVTGPFFFAPRIAGFCRFRVCLVALKSGDAVPTRHAMQRP
ncbi:MAG TPA: hypothetical protein DCY79_12740, partial [Planctomycetaceae bacterium]|nr:hypothetical protein [Planctomycetaceae bacterium]